MPATGRKPKPEDQRRNKSQPTHDWIDVLDERYEGPKPNPGRLPARSKRWWEVVSAMPHCVIWDETDWQFALDTVAIHAEWVRTKRGGLAVELRLREKVLGMTWDARRDLRIRYVQGIEAEPGNTPVSIADRRKELEG